jgi:3-phenylpropionate/trans-cinnamate dioxygenase ferredoxin reductase component
VEHWANALNGGPLAARAMLDHDDRYERLPYFFTDQYDLGMEYAGWVPPDTATDLVIRGDLETREFIAFWIVDGRVAAGMNVNVWDVADPIRRLIRDRVAVNDKHLADPDLPLDQLTPAHEGAAA